LGDERRDVSNCMVAKGCDDKQLSGLRLAIRYVTRRE